MKILSFQQDWLVPELRSLGVDARSGGFRPHLEFQFSTPGMTLEAALAELPADFRPDAVVFWDDSNPIRLTGLDQSPLPLVFYSVDTHHHSVYHRHLSLLMDLTLVAQKDYLKDFPAANQRIEWFPLWASRMATPQPEKIYDAVFVGNLDPALHPERAIFFDALKRLVPIHVTMGDWAEIFPKSKIVVNQAVKGDLNFRVFEAMISGALLITQESSNGLNDLFRVGEHLLTYKPNTPVDAAEKIRMALSNWDHYKTVAAAGHAETARNHTPLARAQKLLQLVGGLRRGVHPHRAVASAVSCCSLLRSIRELKANEVSLIMRSAKQSIQQIVAEKTIFSPEGMENLTALALKLDRDENSNLLEQLCEVYPGQPVFELTLIARLIEQSRLDEARARARKLAARPEEEIMRGAQELAAALKI